MVVTNISAPTRLYRSQAPFDHVTKRYHLSADEISSTLRRSVSKSRDYKTSGYIYRHLNLGRLKLSLRYAGCQRLYTVTIFWFNAETKLTSLVIVESCLGKIYTLGKLYMHDIPIPVSIQLLYILPLSFGSYWHNPIYLVSWACFAAVVPAGHATPAAFMRSCISVSTIFVNHTKGCRRQAKSLDEEKWKVRKLTILWILHSIWICDLGF
jgi:hypothetical protein